MKVLVTGASGFIGRYLVDALRVRGHTVKGLDRRGADPCDLLHPGAFQGAARDFSPHVVVHLAALTGRVFGEDNVALTARSNGEMCATIARACREMDLRLMYASSSEIYGDHGDAVCDEDTPLDVLPHNLYGLTKRWGEEACQLYVPEQKLTVMRFTMPYGIGVLPGRGRAALPNIIWQAHTHQPIPIHKGAERSWCWIGDLIDAVVLLLEDGHCGTWNVGRDDDSRPLRELAEFACDLTGASRGLIEDIDPPEAQTVVKRLSTEKLQGLGWAPTVDIHDGMRRVLSWIAQFDEKGRRAA